MSRVRVLVCGTNYGYHYLEAIRRAPRRYQLAGIVARGSLRSALVAAAHAVPLYRNVDDVPDDIDVAVAAMGAPGRDVVLQLLRRGIPVLCEHPVDPDFVQAALKSGAVFHVNAHFAHLAPARGFIARCARRIQRERPLSLEATLTPRLLYGFVDIVRRALGPLQLSETRGTIAGVPATLRFEPLRPEGRHVVDCRIDVRFETGVVTLSSPRAPAEQRLKAVSSSLAAFVDHVQGKPAPADQTSEHLLDVARAVEAIAASLTRRTRGASRKA